MRTRRLGDYGVTQCKTLVVIARKFLTGEGPVTDGRSQMLMRLFGSERSKDGNLCMAVGHVVYNGKESCMQPGATRMIRLATLSMFSSSEKNSKQMLLSTRRVRT
mmetsp:Transcript_15174/g.22261  ORF Transcript_15174/g.22261 Transcript_15174/m.22261 type:complete len:105 (-) Transcript_15174:71-385(-)